MTRLTGRLLLNGELALGSLEVEGERIASLERSLDPNPEDEPGALAAMPIIAPGLIDLHIHGFGGCDPLDDLAGMGRALARAGTTGFQPTLFPRDPHLLGEDARRVEQQTRAVAGTPGIARPLGSHLEGPFLNPASAGAIPVPDLAIPSREGLRAILGSPTGDGNGVARMTIAPELAGCPELIAELVKGGVRASLGHSLASAGEARIGFAYGASTVTHLFNAMGPLHHREVGLAGIALTRDHLAAEIIGDLVHVSKEAFEFALAARGPSGLCLVSDALKGAGTGCDVFHWHGRDHVVHGGTAYYPREEQTQGGADEGPGQLAGSASSQLEMVRKLTSEGVVGLADALTMASTTPAQALGIADEVGVLRGGARADLIVLEPASLELREVWIGGQRMSIQGA